ncbi:MAG TPA: hypothetical protein VK453_25035 [Micromonosporaceae bacterium]|nr:hypothetical protein [Micromonosporaceae bacterium]
MASSPTSAPGGTEGVDDIAEITRILTALAIRRRWIHADAARSGIPIADGRTTRIDRL